ncbi:hypothetical protein SODALDRAFT_377199 [Sodiomyces alkalinus F11]|uniref:Uncharacterized protein n=1 Tax=Sodiomyces alkalinus (strain CBS 110278 / VKM F-3762 / F11) TaxID=1314773 RepID=A0A3N2Q4F7_SODAK|nr:hypothetical protein SODALDRAFT_377199 [Sodiomyces alkalinus F11]ROT41538.1 hypothetical protein SODALDRAFT_377199 [Sodiomyces alkalinus F11]
MEDRHDRAGNRLCSLTIEATRSNGNPMAALFDDCVNYLPWSGLACFPNGFINTTQARHVQAAIYIIYDGMSSRIIRANIRFISYILLREPISLKYRVDVGPTNPACVSCRLRLRRNDDVNQGGDGSRLIRFCPSFSDELYSTQVTLYFRLRFTNSFETDSSDVSLNDNLEVFRFITIIYDNSMALLESLISPGSDIQSLRTRKIKRSSFILPCVPESVSVASINTVKSTMTQKPSTVKPSRVSQKSSNKGSQPTVNGRATRTHPPPSKPQGPETTNSQAAFSSLPVPLQQRILDEFQRSFGDLFQPAAPDGSPTLTTLLQEIKAALFNRDFAAAFQNARPALLEAYAARWSPTRALGYASVLVGLAGHLDGILLPGLPPPEAVDGIGGDTSTANAHNTRILKVLSIGGGAAEISALAAFLAHQNTLSQARTFSGTITLLDSAPWSPAIAKLHDAMTTPPPLSKYASAAVRAANTPLILPGQLSSTFVHADVLAMTREELASRLDGPSLVTLFFTLNELFTAGGIGKTTAFLLNLTAVIPVGSLLLVVDSPGSYSEAVVGKESKRYPMHWLLDHALLKRGRLAQDDTISDGGCTWEKVEENESVWFRLSDSLRYPIQLENMRYQMHLYRATKQL